MPRGEPGDLIEHTTPGAAPDGAALLACECASSFDGGAPHHHVGGMCGRIIQASNPVRLAILDGLDVHDHRLDNFPRRYNGAPSREILVIRENRKTGERTLEPLYWGLIPYWCHDKKGGQRPINAMAETVHQRPMFRDAYARRRCIVPVDGFFEWKAITGSKAKQPYAVAMKDGLPFGLAGLWENWKNPAGEWVRTFAIIVTDANELVGQLHDRMPVILHRADYERWLSAESDPRDLLRPFESEAMRIWPVSTRVNKPENDDPSILDEVVAEATEAV